MRTFSQALVALGFVLMMGADASAQTKSAAAGVVRLVIETDKGDIAVSLDSAHAPRTVANFLRYVDGGFYSGGRFYRTVTAANQPNDSVKIAVIQGGANPAKANDAFPPIELERTSVTGVKHHDGTLSMARSKATNSATTEFFICIGDQPSLDFGGHRNPDGQGFAAFGHVTSGMDVVHAIHQGAVNVQQLVTPVAIRRIRRVPSTP